MPRELSLSVDLAVDWAMLSHENALRVWQLPVIGGSLMTERLDAILG